MTRCFFDMEFTSLHQRAEPISLGMVTDFGPHTFYAEFTDYDPGLVNAWVDGNVLPKLRLSRMGAHFGAIAGSLEYRGTRRMAAITIAHWLSDLWRETGGGPPLEMWGDVCAYDWVIFCELLGGSQNLPSCVHYIPFDIATLMKLKGIDPDIDRAAFIGVGDDSLRHDALQDAALTGLCYRALMESWSSFDAELSAAYKAALEDGRDYKLSEMVKRQLQKMIAKIEGGSQ